MNASMYTGALCCALIGCAANPPVTSLSPDTYMITRIDKGGIFGNAAAMKADVIREASEFASRQGKVAVPLFVHETPLRPCPACWASIEYQFRVGEPSDPEVRRTSLTPVAPRSEVIIENPTPASASTISRCASTPSRSGAHPSALLHRKTGPFSPAHWPPVSRSRVPAEPARAGPACVAPCRVRCATRSPGRASFPTRRPRASSFRASRTRRVTCC
jgi:hypothetical protein